jgi:hypothetical protein
MQHTGSSQLLCTCMVQTKCSLCAESRRLGSVFQRLLWRKLTFSIETSTAAMCPTETLVALKWEAIFGQFLSLIQDEIRGSYRTKAVIFG